MDAAASLYHLGDGGLSSEDELDSSCPLMDLYVQEAKSRTVVKTMSPFTFREFERLWDMVSVDFISGMTNGKGPNLTTKPKDIFFMLLSVLKAPSGWDKVGINFGMKGQKAQRIVQRGIEVLAPLVKKLFVREMKKDDFAASGISDCANFPYVHHITDATVLQINRPAGSHSEAKPYFSGEFLFIIVYLFLITSINNDTIRF